MPRATDIVCEVSPDGKIPKRHSAHIRDQLKLYAGGDVRIRVSRPKRSSRANAFYWAGIIEPIRIGMTEAGLGMMTAPDGTPTMVTSEALHYHFKCKHLPFRTAYIFGKDVVLPPTTTELDQTAFSDYIEAIKTDEEVLQLGIFFEEPESFRSYSIAEP